MQGVKLNADGIVDRYGREIADLRAQRVHARHDPELREERERQHQTQEHVAAGECVRGARTPSLLASFVQFSNARAFAACASVMTLVAVGLFLQRPTPSAPAMAASQGSILRATASGIELNQGGETLSLLHVRTGDVTYSAGAQGSMRAGYVDSDTGNVTINNLYVQ